MGARLFSFLSLTTYRALLVTVTLGSELSSLCLHATARANWDSSFQVDPSLLPLLAPEFKWAVARPKTKKKMSQTIQGNKCVLSSKRTKRLLFVNATPNSLFSSRLALRIRRGFLFFVFFIAACYQIKHTVFRMRGSSFWWVTMVTLIASQVSCYTAAYRVHLVGEE